MHHIYRYFLELHFEINVGNINLFYVQKEVDRLRHILIIREHINLKISASGKKYLYCIINHRYNIDSINVYTFVNNDSCNAPINSPYSLICLDRSFNDQIEYTHTAD